MLRKINELVKRARMAKVHALVIGHLRSQLPVFNRKKKQEHLTRDLANEFFTVKKTHDLVLGDFPDVERFQEKLSTFDDWGRSFKKLDQKMLDKVEEAMSVQIPMLMKQLPALHREQHQEEEAAAAGVVNPFGDFEDHTGPGGVQWAITGAKKSHFDNIFGDLVVRAWVSGWASACVGWCAGEWLSREVL